MRKVFVLGNVLCFLYKDVFEINYKWLLNLEMIDLCDFLIFFFN